MSSPSLWGDTPISTLPDAGACNETVLIRVPVRVAEGLKEARVIDGATPSIFDPVPTSSTTQGGLGIEDEVCSTFASSDMGDLFGRFDEGIGSERAASPIPIPNKKAKKTGLSSVKRVPIAQDTKPPMTAPERRTEYYPHLRARLQECKQKIALKKEELHKAQLANPRNVDNSWEATKSHGDLLEALDTLGLEQYSSVSMTRLNQAVIECVQCEPEQVEKFAKARSTITNNQAADTKTALRYDCEARYIEDGNLSQLGHNKHKLSVNYLAVVRSGKHEIHVPLPVARVSGLEKGIVTGNLKKVWKWMHKHGIANQVGLWEAYELAKESKEENPSPSGKSCVDTYDGPWSQPPQHPDWGFRP